VLFLPGDSRWHGFQPITGKEAREEQKTFTAPQKKPKQTNQTLRCVRSVVSPLQTNTKRKVVTKDRPQKKKKKTLQHTRARTKKHKTQQTNKKTHKEEEEEEEAKEGKAKVTRQR
jgi:hypothetical protein